MRIQAENYQAAINHDSESFEGAEDESHLDGSSSYSDDDSDDEDWQVKRQIRDSMHKTHMHSVKMPLADQMENDLSEEESGEAELSSQEGEVEVVESVDEEVEEYDESDSDEHEDEDMDLGNTIAKLDRRIKGQPTPDKMIVSATKVQKLASQQGETASNEGAIVKV